MPPSNRRTAQTFQRSQRVRHLRKSVNLSTKRKDKRVIASVPGRVGLTADEYFEHQTSGKDFVFVGQTRDCTGSV